ncbi:MAG: TrkH family potassium uptake protein [Anaerovoracaceae bacterium]
MHGRHKDFIRIQGAVLLILAAAMTIPFVLAMCFEERASAFGFGTVIVFCIITGLLIRGLLKPSPEKFKSRDGFFVVSLTWLVCSIVGAAPFVISGAIPGIADAVFESCSGFSTTGASILSDIEVLPKSILFWRSFTHWLGGMGIIVFIMAILPALGISGQMVAYAETPGPIKDKFTARFSDTAKGLYKLYIGLTAAEVILLKIGGISWYDAFVHTFGTVGTGGFSSYNTSIAHFTSPYIQIVIIVFMVLAGMNFNLYYVGIIQRHGLRTIFRDDETKFYLSVMGLATGVIFIYNGILSGFRHAGTNLLGAAFQVASITTTTGYATENFDLWPTFSKMVIFALFFFGGCSGSTGGGIKCIRVLICMKLLRRSFSLKVHPNRIVPLSLNGKDLSPDVVIKITNFVFTYVAVLFAGTLLLALDNMDFMSTLSAAASCLGNIGPGFNLVGPVMNYSGLTTFSKYVCSFLMIAGRLELFTVFTLFSRYYWNSNRV